MIANFPGLKSRFGTLINTGIVSSDDTTFHGQSMVNDKLWTMVVLSEPSLKSDCDNYLGAIPMNINGTYFGVNMHILHSKHEKKPTTFLFLIEVLLMLCLTVESILFSRQMLCISKKDVKKYPEQ